MTSSISSVRDTFQAASAALVQENISLTEKLDEVQAELAAWRAGQKAATAESKVLQTELEDQKRLLSAYDAQSLVFVLLDGDGSLFRPQLVAKGKDGGREAAQILNRHLHDYVSAQLPGSTCEIVVNVYMNKTGLTYFYEKEKWADHKQYNAFCQGFTQATPLYTIIDSGMGKESADSKLRESIKLYASLPQCKLVLFSAHDAGYSHALSALMNKGLGSKIHLLHTHANIPFELKALNLTSTTFPDLFIDQRGGSIVGNSQRTKSDLVIPAGPFSPKATAPPTGPRSASPVKETTLNKKPNNYRTVPCVNYHLDKCKFGAACNFSHEPISEETKALLKDKWAGTGKFGNANGSQEKEKADSENGEVFLYEPTSKASTKTTEESDGKFKPLVKAIQSVASETSKPLRSKIGAMSQVRQAIKHYGVENFKTYTLQAAEYGYVSLVPATSKGPGSETLKLTAAGQKLANKKQKEKKAGLDSKGSDMPKEDASAGTKVEPASLSVNMAQTVLDDRDADDEDAEERPHVQAAGDEEQWEDIP